MYFWFFMNPLDIKEQLYHFCATTVAQRLSRIQQTISRLQEALTSETKSTAGDKHETGRAMLQLEREKTGNQLAEVQKLQQILAKINTRVDASRIHLGSVVYTSLSNYYIGISIGEIIIDNTKFFAIAPNTPIGKALIGKEQGDFFVFNGKKFEILTLF